MAVPPKIRAELEALVADVDLIRGEDHEIASEIASDVLVYLEQFGQYGISGPLILAPDLYVSGNDAQTRSFQHSIADLLHENDVDVRIVNHTCGPSDYFNSVSDTEEVANNPLLNLLEALSTIEIDDKPIESFDLIGAEYRYGQSWAVKASTESGTYVLKIQSPQDASRDSTIKVLGDLKGKEGAERIPRLVQTGKLVRKGSEGAENNLRNSPDSYYVTDIFEGFRSLEECFASDDFVLSPREALHITYQVLDTLILFHENDYLFRDVSGYNILINDDLDVRVIDPGISAKSENVNSGVHMSGTNDYAEHSSINLAMDTHVFLGGPHEMARFIPDASFREYDDYMEEKKPFNVESMDLAQVGVLLFHLVTNGQYSAFASPLDFKLMHQQYQSVKGGSATLGLASNLLDPNSSDKRMPRVIAEIINQAIDHVPTARFQDVYGMMESIRFAQRGTNSQPQYSSGSESGTLKITHLVPQRRGRRITGATEVEDIISADQFMSKFFENKPYSTQLFRELNTYVPDLQDRIVSRAYAHLSGEESSPNQDVKGYTDEQLKGLSWSHQVFPALSLLSAVGEENALLSRITPLMFGNDLPYRTELNDFLSMHYKLSDRLRDKS